MKVRLFTLAAVAAITLTSQGVAQQNDSLERALADLNSGLTAPTGNSAVAIGGDFRTRNRWFDSDTANATNNRDVDTRARMTFTFNVTESSTAFVGFNGRETWGDAGSGTTPGRFDDPADTFQLTRSWVSVDSLFGEGGTAKIGRDYYTAGSGRILGSEDWDNRPSTNAGVWYNHPAGGLNIHFAAMTGRENGFNSVGSPGVLTDEGDDFIYVAGFNWVFDYVEQLGPMHLAPYWIRNEDTGAEFESWLGILLSGEFMGFGYEAEYATFEQGDLLDGDAWYIATTIDLEALESIPGVESGGLDVSISSSDEEFRTTGTTRYHNAAGFSDLLGADGLWTPDTDTWQIGLSFSPSESWTGRVAVANVETGAIEWDEIDISLGTTFGGNVEGWFGYAMVDAKTGAFGDEDTFWAVLDLNFGE